MSFIIFCLIFRTGYQGIYFFNLLERLFFLYFVLLGVFFEMLTNDLRRSPPETFADLKERNYTLNYLHNFKESLILSDIPENER